MSVNLTTHVAGLASGMDTEKIVSDLMKANRVPLDKLGQAKQINQWKTDAYRDINTKIASFQSAMQDLRLQGTFNAQKISSGNSAVDVSMAGTSTLMNYTITDAKLVTPATAASVSFNSNIKSGSSIIDSTISAGNSRTISFTLNGSSGLNSNTAANINISVTGTTTYDDVIAQINSQSANAGIKAANVGGSIVFTTTAASSGKSITITNSTSNPDTQAILGITDGSTNSTAASNSGTVQFTGSTDGANSAPGAVTINGTTISISNNTFTYDGVQFTLKQNIKSANNDSPAVISVASDTDKVFDKIKTFVDQYNDLIKTLNDKISEPKNRDYPPLTDDQKKDMKDADITLWEDKAKSGLLANDSTIQQFLTQLRRGISDTVQGSGINSSFDTLKEIGITTSTNYKDNGKLILDESKLKSVLASNLSDVQNLFSTNFDTSKVTDTTLTSAEKYQKSGLGFRVNDQINDTLSRLKVIAGAPGTVSLNSDLAKEATSLTDRMTRLQDQLNTEEQNLWTKFNAMESALQKMNSQSTWLTQQLGQ